FTLQEPGKPRPISGHVLSESGSDVGIVSGRGTTREQAHCRRLDGIEHYCWIIAPLNYCTTLGLAATSHFWHERTGFGWGYGKRARPERKILPGGQADTR